MPALQNVRHERFAQNIATSTKTTWSNGRCYSEAGFKTDNRSADACAARLLTNANVSARIEELLAPIVQKTRTTVDTLAAQLDAVFDGASGDRQWGAAGSAAALKAKLLGFMREKIEVGGPGAFVPQTVDEVLERVSRELGPEAATVVAWTCGGPDEPMPFDAVARTTLQGMTLDQALSRIEELRLALLRVAGDDAKVVETVEDDPPHDTVDGEAFPPLTRPKHRSTRRSFGPKRRFN